MKAIIPAAGLGTRFLPTTAACPKELLPLYDRPVIDYVAREALANESVDEVVIVTNSDKSALEKYFDPSSKLIGELRERGKQSAADELERIGELPVSFVVQDEALGLGHAVHCAARKTNGDRFALLLGDYAVPTNSMLSRMIEISDMHDGASVIAVAPCDWEDVSRYGIIDGSKIGSFGELDDNESGSTSSCDVRDDEAIYTDVADDEAGDYKIGDILELSTMIEKPAREDAPTNLYVVGRYILSPIVMNLLADQEPGAGGEIQLTDAMLRSLESEQMYAFVVDPRDGYDTGKPDEWLSESARWRDDKKLIDERGHNC